MAHWKILEEIKSKKPGERKKEIIDVLLKNRGVMTKKGAKEFVNPQLELNSFQKLVSSKDFDLSLERIKKAIKKKESIVIFGDYDCDGVCGTAILWQALNSLGAKVKPFIPERSDGYGLSPEGIENIKDLEPELIITVDNGISAVGAVNHASDLGIDIIVTDHHLLPKKTPPALAILHSVKLSGAAVAWVLAGALTKGVRSPTAGLDLAALATVADLVPLIGPSRTLVKFGLEEINKTENVGLKALVDQTGLKLGEVQTYHLGWILGPRINAAGRVESAMDSLRLLCMEDAPWADKLAERLSRINQKRQQLTQTSLSRALTQVDEKALPHLIFISDPSFEEGLVGLIASKIVEKFYRPTIVGVDKGDVIQASARSISSFNIVEAISKTEALLEEFGGHPMAAGLTVKKKNFPLVKEKLEIFAQENLGPDDLVPGYRVDCEVDLADLNWDLWEELDKFEPFGMGNPRPTFLTTGLKITQMRAVGNNGKHLKLKLDDVETKKIEKIEADFPSSSFPFDGIGFNLGFWETELSPGEVVDVVYTLDKNVWNNQENLQLKVKDLKRKEEFIV